MSEDSARSHPEGIIIEGITGAGKTHTMKALTASDYLRTHWSPYDLYREKETFGEFMGEILEHPDAPAKSKFRLLTKSIQRALLRAERSAGYRFIMERAHYSYYALLPDWSLYTAFDEQIAGLNAHVFLLWIPDDLLKDRSLYRQDRQEWASGFVSLYGSESSAIEAIRSSQNARYEAIKKSAVPHTVIDTRTMEWERYANDIVAEIRRSKAPVQPPSARNADLGRQR